MASGLAAHFRMLGRYNRLANERLYAACADLDDAAQTHHRGQITAMLRQTDCPDPDLDMHRVVIPEPGSHPRSTSDDGPTSWARMPRVHTPPRTAP